MCCCVLLGKRARSGPVFVLCSGKVSGLLSSGTFKCLGIDFALIDFTNLTFSLITETGMCHYCRFLRFETLIYTNAH